MTGKKLKTMGSILLSVIFIISLCLSNFSFATVSDAVYPPQILTVMN